MDSDDAARLAEKMLAAELPRRWRHVRSVARRARWTAKLLKTLGVAQRDAMQILGHARISVTLEIYTDSDSQRDALTGMSDRLFGPSGK
jgi:hypothetical protein